LSSTAVAEKYLANIWLLTKTWRGC